MTLPVFIRTPSPAAVFTPLQGQINLLEPQLDLATPKPENERLMKELMVVRYKTPGSSHPQNPPFLENLREINRNREEPMYSLRGDALEPDLPWMRAEEPEMDLKQIRGQN